MLIVWYYTQIIYFGFFIILPESLSFGGGNSAVLVGWLVAAVVQLPFHAVNAIFTGWLGTKNMMIIASGGLIAFEALSIGLVGTGAYLVCVVGLTAFGIILFSSNFAYTNQIYESSVRSMATGFFNIICNVTGIMTPIIMYRLNDIDSTMPYALMLVLAMVAFTSSLALPKTLFNIFKLNH